MSWRIVVISKRAKLDLQLGQMVVRGEEVTKIVLSEISTILIESTAVSLTASLIAELAKRKIKVIFCDEKKNPSCELVNYYGSHDTSNKVRKQINWKKNTKEAVWTEIVSEKIRKQKELLELLGKEESDLLESYLKEIAWNDGTNREGHAAKVYFNALFGLEFTRTEDNLINAALNYGYSIILSAFTREIVANGYITQLGVFHDNMFNQFNLASDLMEPFRILVDRQVLTMKLLSDKYVFTEWIIESPKLYAYYLQELFLQQNGEEGRFVLSDKEKELNIAKNMEIIVNPFQIEINGRKILNKLYAELDQLSKSELMYVKTLELTGKIQEYLLELEQNTEYVLEFDMDLDMPALFKSVGIRYEVQETDFFEQIIRYIKIAVNVLATKVFVFINLRSYLTDLQMQELIKEISYQDVKGLFIENHERSCMEGGMRYIIDRDGCEIY